MASATSRAVAGGGPPCVAALRHPYLSLPARPGPPVGLGCHRAARSSHDGGLIFLCRPVGRALYHSQEGGALQTPGCIFTSRRGVCILTRQLQGRRVNHWVRGWRGAGHGRRRAARCSLGPTLSEALPGPYTHPLPAQETREPDQPPPQARTGLSRSLEGAGGWRLAQLCRHPRVGVWESGVRPSALSFPVPSPAPAAQGCEETRGHQPARARASASSCRRAN